MTFTKAIVRTPGPSMIDGLTSANLGRPHYATAVAQHAAYVTALRSSGLQVTVLPPDDKHPDSTFVEDTALLTPACAIITRPGAMSRRGETESIATALREFYTVIDAIRPPGTVDAGDIMMVEDHYYIGLSQRTNAAGADQVIKILKRHGLTGSTIPLQNVLHLKSGVAYIENGYIVATAEFGSRPEFGNLKAITVDDDERYAANCLCLNGTVLLAAGYPKIKEAIEAIGYRTIILDMSEYQKLDGGLSCLSLRF